jgi:hypothetical protein
VLITCYSATSIVHNIIFVLCAEMDTMFDLIIHHHGSLFGHRMEYIRGDIMEIQQLDADKFASWDITNVLVGYLGYRYNDIPAMY